LFVPTPPPPTPPLFPYTTLFRSINSFCRGHSGVRPATVAMLVELLNKGVHPAVPAQGSLGASGDLAPLAHIALVLLGEGQAYVGERLLPGAEALAAAGLKPAAQIGRA